MLKSIKQLFKSETSTTAPSDSDLKLAAATLMYEMIRSDGVVDEVELQSMQDLLKTEFELAPDVLQELFEDAQESSQQAISLQGFTREICDNWGNEKRIKMIEYLWTIAFADEHIDAHERHLVRKVAGLLYVNDTEIQFARAAAMKKLGISQT